MVDNSTPLAIPRSNAAEQTDLSEVVQDVIHMLAPRIGEQRIRITLELTGHLLVAGERRPWWKAIYGLFDTALEQTPTGGELNVTAVAHEDGTVELEVADEGPGAAETLRFRLSGSPPAPRDLLAAAGRFARELGGQLEAANCPQGGTALMLCMPSAPRR